MAVSFAVPASPSKSINTFNRFLGCDLTNDTTNMSLNHSPNCENMVRWLPGKTRKSMGYDLDQHIIWFAKECIATCFENYTWQSFLGLNQVLEINSKFEPVTFNLPQSTTERTCYWGNENNHFTLYNVNIKAKDSNNVARCINAFIFLNRSDVYNFHIVSDSTSMNTAPIVTQVGHLLMYTDNMSGGVKYLTSYAGLNSYDLNFVELWGNYSQVKYGSSTVSDYRIYGQLKIYEPTLTISRSASGGGESYEYATYTSPYVCDSFIVESGHEYTNFVLSMSGSSIGKIELLDSDGNWEEITEDFSFDTLTNTVTFVYPIHETPITGMDNLKIHYLHSTSETCMFEKILAEVTTKVGTFLLYNNHNSNKLNFTEPNNLTYAPDINYVPIGDTNSMPIGCVTLNNCLLVFTNGKDNSKNIFVIEPSIEQNVDGGYDTIFRVVNSIQGPTCIDAKSIKSANGEILYLSKNGVFAITTAAINNEKVSEKRSYYINGEILPILRDGNTHTIDSIVEDDYYKLLIDNVIYGLDLSQPISDMNDKGYSTLNYVCFKRTFRNHNYDIKGLLPNGFYDRMGMCYSFFTDVHNGSSYNDCVATNPNSPVTTPFPIYCCYETPDISGSLFYKNKTLKYIAYRLGASNVTSDRILARDRGVWNLVKEDEKKTRYFDFANVDFSNFTFGTDNTSFISKTKVKVKKVDGFALRIENEQLGENLFLNDLGLEFVENGNYKG